MDFEREQKQIVDTVKGERKEGIIRAWNKYNGDVACRIILGHIRSHLPKGYKVVGPNVYIEGIPNELDLLVVTDVAIPRDFTNAYSPDVVSCLIEVKASGYFNKSEPGKYRSLFEGFTQKFPHVRCIYLTIRERGKPKNPYSKNYAGDMKDELEPKFRTFTLSDSRTGKPEIGQWKDFINYLQQSLS